MTVRVCVIALAGIAAGACAPSTTIDQAWMAPTARQQPPLQRVVTMFISENMTLCHSGEDELARELAKRGVRATPAYMIFSDGAQNVRDVEPLKARLRQLGYDGVVTMRVVDREQQIGSVAGTFDGYWGYWGPGYWGGAYWPGYVYSETIYRVEAAAYSLRTGQLVWSAITRTTDPSSAHQLVDDTTEIVAGQLTRNGLAG
jgi:hypothetical protein